MINKKVKMINIKSDNDKYKSYNDKYKSDNDKYKSENDKRNLIQRSCIKNSDNKLRWTNACKSFAFIVNDNGT